MEQFELNARKMVASFLLVHLALLQRQKVLHRPLDDLKTMLGESKIAYHRGLEQADGVARRRVTKARFELFGHRCAADQVPTLEYTDPQAGTC